MEVFTAAPHDDVLKLVIQIAVLLFTARTLGEIAQRFKQPAVIGEILAGILLGPSLLSGFVPFVHHWLIPETPEQGYLLEVIGLLGAMSLLLITGLETDLPLIRRHARTALGAAAGGLVLPLVSGFVLGMYLPDFLLADPEKRLVFALFVAAALSISAIPVIAKVLIDLDLLRRDIGQTIIAAGMVDDTTAWVLLSVIIGLAGGTAVTVTSVLLSVGKVVVFLVFTFTAGQWLVKRALDYVQDEVISAERLLSLVVILTFAWGAITQAIHLEAIFGAFMMGILFGQMQRLPERVVHKLDSLALGIFAPIFFAIAGLKVNLLKLADPRLIGFALIVIAIAILGKVVGAYVGARTIGRRDHWTSLTYGAALNARGAMEIIIATVGLSAGILSQEMFSIIVVMAMVTSLMAPSALRWTLSHIEPEKEELERLQREALAQHSPVAGIHRVLLPIRRREKTETAVQIIEARLLELLTAKANLSLTLMNVAQNGERPLGVEFLNQLGQRFPQRELLKKVVENDSPMNAILDEAAKDYDLLVLGAPEGKQQDNLFSHLVDNLVRMAPCLTMVVKGPQNLEQWTPYRILVPTNGSLSARYAAEMGFMLASASEGQVIILHVMESLVGFYHLHDEAVFQIPQRQRETAEQIVRELAELGKSAGVQAETVIHVASNPESAIIDMAKQNNFDLIILGTDLRPGSTRLFFGPRVEYMLENAPCPVIILDSN